MASNHGDMTRDEIRAALLAKIEAAWPAYKENPELARAVELGSNDDLRKHLAFAELFAEVGVGLPQSDEDDSDNDDFDEDGGLSPRYSDDDRALFKRVLSTKWSQDGRYTLAKDECGDWYDGPAWVPFNLYSCSNYCGGTSEEQTCAKTLINAPGAEKLWSDIGHKHARNPITKAKENRLDSIAAGLPRACAAAKANWAAIPRLTPSKFGEQREALARHAEQLAVELERFYLPRDPDECEFSGLLDFAELMTQEELDRFDQAIRITTFRIANSARKRAGARGMDWEEYNDIGDDAKALGYSSGDLRSMARMDAREVYALMQRDHVRPDLPYGGVPTLPDMLRRIADKFKEDASYPPLSRPNGANAERNFFARFLCKYFWQSFGDVSPSIVRDIVSIFYPQTITENDVSQIAAKVKRDHPLPPGPETSTPK